MPLFSSHHREPSPELVYEPEPKKHGLFHRNPSPPAHEPVVAAESPTRKHGLFHRHEPSPSVSSASSSGSSLHRGHTHRSSRLSTGGGLLTKLGRNDVEVDPSILQARERVMDAEEAEEQADRALDQARLRVREAREHMKRVEAEAKEDARRAKIKQQHVREVTKRGKGLGRHGI